MSLVLVWGLYSKMITFSGHALEKCRSKEEHKLWIMDTLDPCTFCPWVSMVLWAIVPSLSFSLSIRSNAEWMDYNVMYLSAENVVCIYLQRNGSSVCGTQSTHSIELNWLQRTNSWSLYLSDHPDGLKWPSRKMVLFKWQTSELTTAVWNMFTKIMCSKFCISLSSFHSLSWLVFFLAYFFHALCIHLVVLSLRYKGRDSWGFSTCIKTDSSFMVEELCTLNFTGSERRTHCCWKWILSSTLHMWKYIKRKTSLPKIQSFSWIEIGFGDCFSLAFFSFINFVLLVCILYLYYLYDFSSKELVPESCLKFHFIHKTSYFLIVMKCLFPIILWGEWIFLFLFLFQMETLRCQRYTTNARILEAGTGGYEF